MTKTSINIFESIKSNCIYCKKELHVPEEQYHITCHEEVIAYQNRPISIVEWLYEHGINKFEEDLLNLKILDLSFKQLSSLPKEIGQLKQLETLWLFRNQLTSLPMEIGQLNQLERLYLSNNRLSSLPPEIGQLQQLKELSLSNNQLSSLPKEIEQLKQLDVLKLSNNKFSQEELKRIKLLLPETQIFT